MFPVFEGQILDPYRISSQKCVQYLVTSSIAFLKMKKKKLEKNLIWSLQAIQKQGNITLDWGPFIIDVTQIYPPPSHKISSNYNL